MSKIALVSYHFYYNYGTCLQAYALYHYLAQKGHDCEYINFGQCRCEGGVGSRSSMLSRVKSILRALKYICYSKQVKSNKRQFDLFRKKNVRETREFTFNELSQIENNYDLFILGSDQTLNPDCIGLDFYKKLLLDFVNDSQKKVSFASSLGKAKLSTLQTESLKQLLSSYQHLAVRESQSAAMLSKLLGSEVQCVLDPTFLLNKKEWLALSNPNYKTKFKNYVFCYLLGSKESIVSFAKKIASEKKLKLILYTNQQKFYHIADSLLEECGPFEFVKTISSAKYVVTDSFHGSVLSVNCNVNFYAFTKLVGNESSGDNARILDFLRLIGLENRLQDSSPVILPDIDYAKINERIVILKEKTEMFLNQVVC